MQLENEISFVALLFQTSLHFLPEPPQALSQAPREKRITCISIIHSTLKHKSHLNSILRNKHVHEPRSMTNIIDNLNSNPLNTSAASSNTTTNSGNITPGPSSVSANSITSHGSTSGVGSNHETCLICGDVASGKHYGLRSCEACKAFFKRTVQGKIEYSCPATRECEINKRRRKACQACRFQKCLNMGMLKEGVRLDRVRGGRQKYRRGISPTPGSFAANNVNSSVATISNNSSSSGAVLSGASNGRATSSSSSSLSKTTTSLGSTTSLAHPLSGASVTATHLQTSVGTGETNKIMTALINCEPEELSVSSTQYISNIPANMTVQLKTLNILSDLFDRELVSLIGWAKQIPGFTETITLNDQMRLLQSTWAEVIALSIGYRSHLKRIENFRQQQQQQQQHGNGNHHHFMNATTPSPTSSSPASTTSSSYNTNSSNNNTTIYSLENIEIRLVFAKDLIIDFKNAITCGAEEIFYNCVQLIKRLDYLRITPKEYILLKAISLTNADVRLENPKATFRLRDLVMDALYEVTLAECLNGGLTNRNDVSSLGTNAKQEVSGLSNASNYNNQAKVEAQERPPSSMNQYASSSSSPTPPSRSSSSVPSSSSILSISPQNGGNSNTNNNNSSTTNSTNLDLSKKTIVNNRMNQVLLCLPVLRQIDTCIRKFWNDIRKGPNNVPMNKLFEEMLEPCQRMYRSSVEM